MAGNCKMLLEMRGDLAYLQFLHHRAGFGPDFPVAGLVIADRRRREPMEPLLEGRDVLTNMHANTTIPEVLGCARAYEVTGEEKWLEIVKCYWKCAVTDRGGVTKEKFRQSNHIVNGAMLLVFVPQSGFQLLHGSPDLPFVLDRKGKKHLGTPVQSA